MMTSSRSAKRPETRSQVLIIAGPTPHDSGIASLLLRHNITFAFSATPEGMSEVSPDLVIMNLDALNAASPSKVRKARWYGVPVLCTIPREESDNVLMIEQVGADDYIIRPFHPEDLLFRIQLLLRGQERSSDESMIDRRVLDRRRGDRSRRPLETSERKPLCSIDDRRKLVVIQDREIRLTPKEYDLFCLLASERGRVFSNQEIIERTWPSAKRASVLDVQQYIHLLRRKIETDPAHPRWIVTVQGFGYKLELPAEP